MSTEFGVKHSGIAPFPPAGTREPAQRTLAAIGDVGVAVNETADRVRQASPAAFWISLLAFTALVYAASAGASWLVAEKEEAWIRILLIPLLPTVAAISAYWSRLEWKQKAGEYRAEAKQTRDALETLSFTAANAASVVRSNLLGWKNAGKDAARDAHLQEIDAAATRIDYAVRRAQLPR